METLADFPPRLAGAVVAVLVRAGVPATVGRPVPGTGDVAVMVPAARRREALATLAARMEEVHAEEVDRPATPDPAPDPDDAPAPLVLERLRRHGLLVFVVVPLLIVALAIPGVPVWLVATVCAGGLAALIAGRARAREGERQPHDRRE